MPRGVPPWLHELVACPDDGQALAPDRDGFACPRCSRHYPVAAGVLELLPSHLRDEEAAWVAEEKEWWDRWATTEPERAYTPDRGLRGRSRERNLFRHVRAANEGRSVTLIELGAGSSRSVAGLWAPSADGPRYVATDISGQWLRAGATLRGPHAAAIQCDAGHWPFRPSSADVVAVLGTLHHLPDWRRSLARACTTVRPGGYMMLHEVVEKPRFLASRRSAGLCDEWTSPHEGSVSAADLKAELERDGRILRWRGESTPMRSMAVYYGNLHDSLERSRALTVAFDVLDQVWGRSVGRVMPSLGFAEVTCVWQRSPGK